MADGIFNQGGSFLQMSRFKPKDSDFENNFNLKFFTDNNVKLLVTVGGDDTASTANRIAKFLEAKKYPIANIHVPKTIDNDLFGTDHCPGFASAAKYIATSCMEVYQDARVYDTGMVCIMEIMGRHAGWLAGAAALATAYGAGPDLVYLPEVDFDMDKFLADVDRIYKEKGNCMVAVSRASTMLTAPSSPRPRPLPPTASATLSWAVWLLTWPLWSRKKPAPRSAASS